MGDPLPTMLSPFKIKVDMDFENGAKMRGNIDMNQFSIDITPKGSDKYNMKFTVTPEAGEMVTKELEFTMTETTIEYKQLKAWKDKDFHMLQDIQVFRPYNTGKRFNWYMKWNGEGEMPYLQHHGDLERASNIFYILEDILLKNDFDFEW